MARNEIRLIAPSNVVSIICPVCGRTRLTFHRTCARFQQEHRLACAAFTHCLWDSGIENFNEYVRLFTEAQSPKAIIALCRNIQLAILDALPHRRLRLVGVHGAPSPREALALERLDGIVERFKAFFDEPSDTPFAS